MLEQLVRVGKFAAVSGIGLGLDFALFLALVGFGVSPFAANAFSGACAVTFVYFASVRRIFSYHGGFLLHLFTVYLAYQVCGVAAASLAVAYLAEEWVSPGLAKILILPVTFTCNYLFMTLITRKARPAGGVS